MKELVYGGVRKNITCYYQFSFITIIKLLSSLYMYTHYFGCHAIRNRIDAAFFWVNLWFVDWNKSTWPRPAQKKPSTRCFPFQRHIYFESMNRASVWDFICIIYFIWRAKLYVAIKWKIRRTKKRPLENVFRWARAYSLWREGEIDRNKHKILFMIRLLSRQHTRLGIYFCGRTQRMNAVFPGAIFRKKIIWLTINTMQLKTNR